MSMRSKTEGVSKSRPPERLALVAGILTIAVLLAACVVEGQETAEGLFEQGAALIEANCADCLGARAEALDEGVVLLERAIDLGYADKRAALALIEQAQRALYHAFAEPFSEEEGDRRSDLLGTLKRIAELDAATASDVLEYARVLPDSDKLPWLRRAFELDPEDSLVQFHLGRALVESGEEDEGFQLMERGFLGSEGSLAFRLGESLRDLLKDRAKLAKAAEVEARLASLADDNQ